MSTTYSLTAIPWPLRDDKSNAKLEYVLFVATDGSETRKWSVTNTGTTVEYLCRITSADDARNICARLARGEPVRFKGHFDLDKVREKLSRVDRDLRNCG